MTKSKLHLQWVITYNSDREVYYRSLDSSLTTLLKNTCGIIKLPSLYLRSQRKSEQAIYILCSINSHRNTSLQVSSEFYGGVSVGCGKCLSPAEEGHQTRATPQLPFAQPIQDLLSHFSATSSTSQDFFLFPCRRRILEWAVVSEAVLPFLVPHLRKAVGPPSVALMLY